MQAWRAGAAVRRCARVSTRTLNIVWTSRRAGGRHNEPASLVRADQLVAAALQRDAVDSAAPLRGSFGPSLEGVWVDASAQLEAVSRGSPMRTLVRWLQTALADGARASAGTPP
eukprot:364774-Chlamydomonas_euryale.AAC.9